MRKRSIATLLVALTVIAVCWAQNPTTPRAENAAVEAKAASEMGFVRSLREQPLQQDGSRTIRYDDIIEVPLYGRQMDRNGKLIPSPYSSPDDAHLHAAVCRAPAVVIATAGDTEPRLTANEAVVYSVTSFHVDESLKGTAVPHEIQVITLNGEIQYRGETLRVSEDGTQPFMSGHKYLLLYLANRAGQVSNGVINSYLSLPTGYYFDDPKFQISVSDGRVIVFGVDQSLENFRHRIASVLAKIPCPK